MKCICGYEKIGSMWNEEGEYVNVDPEKEPFVRVFVKARFSGESVEEMLLLICPECQTVKADL